MKTRLKIGILVVFPLSMALFYKFLPQYHPRKYHRLERINESLSDSLFILQDMNIRLRYQIEARNRNK